MIKDNLLEKVATSIEKEITKIVLNDDVEIVEFEAKEARQNVVHVDFFVPETLKNINRIRIYSDDEELCDSKLFYVVDSKAQFSYRIEVS